MKKFGPYIIPIIIIIGLVFFYHNSLIAYLGPRPTANLEPPLQSDISGQSSDQQNQVPSRHDYSVPSSTTVNPQQYEGNSIGILMYHEIGAGPNNLYTIPDKFREQMDYLYNSGYHTVTMAEAAEMLAAKDIPAKTIVLTFDDGYASFINQAWPIMKDLGFTGTVFVCTSFVGKQNYLTWDQIKDLQAEGIEIGSHTRNHIDLKQATYQQQVKEILSSKQTLEQSLGVPCLSFCYPSGAHGDVTPTIVKDSGYSSAVTVAFGKASPADNIYLLPRIRISGLISLQQFAAYIPKN